MSTLDQILAVASNAETSSGQISASSLRERVLEFCTGLSPEESFEEFAEEHCFESVYNEEEDDTEVAVSPDIGHVALYLYSLGIDHSNQKLWSDFSDYVRAISTQDELDNYALRNPYV
jgi:hypothetical protein